jgi:hypothetical protein
VGAGLVAVRTHLNPSIEEGSIMLNDVYTEEEKLAKPVSIVTTQQFQGLLWLPKIRSQKNRQVPFSGASFKNQEPV